MQKSDRRRPARGAGILPVKEMDMRVDRAFRRQLDEVNATSPGRVSLALGAMPANATSRTVRSGNATCPPGGGGNVSFSCPGDVELSAPCPSTSVREATVISFTCPHTEAGCAYWDEDEGAWSSPPPGCDTEEDASGGVTCVCDIASSQDYGATSNSVLGTYASAFTSLSARDLLSLEVDIATVYSTVD